MGVRCVNLCSRVCSLNFPRVYEYGVVALSQSSSFHPTSDAWGLCVCGVWVAGLLFAVCLWLVWLDEPVANRPVVLPRRAGVRTVRL